MFSPAKILALGALGLGLWYVVTRRGDDTEETSESEKYPWMTYSLHTAQIQSLINEWRAIGGLPPIEQDGYLGADTCRAWHSWFRDLRNAGLDEAAFRPPTSCNGYG